MRNGAKNIRVSERDLSTIRRLVISALKIQGGVTLEYVRSLSRELDRAEVVPVSRLPRDVIDLNSKVWATDLDSGGKMMITLVLPDFAGKSADHVSIISPLGMALFGYAAGDRLEWGPLQRLIRLQVNRVRQMRARHPSPPTGR